MQESVYDDLIKVGVNVGLALLFFGVLCGSVISCIIDCYKNDDNHDHGESDDHVIITIMESVGIKPSVLQSIPVVDFNTKDFKDSVECVICLSDLVDGDKAKVLPSCNHWFHGDCIDAWFRYDSTCPICRKRVGSMQRRTRQEHGGDDSLARNNNPSPNLARSQTDHHQSTNASVVEYSNSGEAEQVDG